jgi:hypothetical protein
MYFLSVYILVGMGQLQNNLFTVLHVSLSKNVTKHLMSVLYVLDMALYILHVCMLRHISVARVMSLLHVPRHGSPACPASCHTSQCRVPLFHTFITRVTSHLAELEQNLRRERGEALEQRGIPGGGGGAGFGGDNGIIFTVLSVY